MKELRDFVNENLDKRYIALTYDDFKNWLRDKNIKADNTALKTIENLYVVANENNKPAPVIVNFNTRSKKPTFCLRRWVEDENWIKDKQINFNLSNIQEYFMGFHNTILKDGKPNTFTASEIELVICFLYNQKYCDLTDSNENLKYITKKPWNIEDSNKIEVFYNTYKESINAYLEQLNSIVKGKKLRKLENTKLKDVTSVWKTLGEYTDVDHIDYTPKTDIISEDNIRISLKKAFGSQLMSGSKNETMATLKAACDACNKNNNLREEIDILFNNWEKKFERSNKTVRSQQQINNVERTNKLKELLEDKNFKMAVLMEAATGRCKFGKNSPACAEYISTWNFYNNNNSKNTIQTVESYVQQHFNEFEFNISLKTSGNNSYNVLRIISK